ncbi:MAG: anaerobic glycerol-3-phosphate dehydrogenase subunit A [Desulfovibrio sp.]|jgi:glycerol-3-phosphate dehydrogenase|nr:anaerobic glycerol-3-phosphate dehydrogenase subunit A [Desulfovibrio sp.]
MRKAEGTRVVVIGGGATGTGILRDLSLRGIPALLLERGDLGSGTSSRFHGLLHSGARYAAGDPESARECIRENGVLRRIAPDCVEETEGWFVRSPGDDPAFEPVWLRACADCGIEVRRIDPKDAFRLEPNLARDARAVFRVPDSAVDGFRMVWHNAMSARRRGGRLRTYTRVTGITLEGGAVAGVTAVGASGESGRIPCEYVINAAGSWAGEVAALAGLRVPVSPDRGLLLAFNHRFLDRVVNRLRPPSDGDIFVPHGSVVIFGTTSVPVDRPDDVTPTSAEALRLLDEGEVLFPGLRGYRLLRAFAGTRPLYSPEALSGRAATRDFVILDHEREGCRGMATITGGKFTSFRLMAERICDLAAKRLGVTAPCRTAQEAILPSRSGEELRRARKIFPLGGADLAASRLGDGLEKAMGIAEEAPWKKLLLCECELVTLAEFEAIASEPTSRSLSDIRRRTRMGMGTCQGGFCGFRAAGALAEAGISACPQDVARAFLEERWHGVRPLLWGNQLREVELERGIYGASLNLDGARDLPEDRPAPVSGVLRPPPAPISAALRTSEQECDVLVVGAGLSGLIAALVAARRGRKTLLLCKGAGALSIGGGTIDLLGYIEGEAVRGDPFAAFGRLAPDHPYALLGADRVRASLDFLLALAAEKGFPLFQAGSPEKGNAWLPTAAGTLKPVWLAGESGDCAVFDSARSIAVVGVEGMKDFSPRMVVRGLGPRAPFAGKDLRPSFLPRPSILAAEGGRDITAFDLARFMDTPEGLSWLGETLPAAAGSAEAVFLPSFLGIRRAAAAHTLLERLGLRVTELACPPPAVTGLRLQTMLREALRGLSVPVLGNVEVSGSLTDRGRCLGLTAERAGTRHLYRAASYIIATGGIFGKGIATLPGQAFETIFRLPVPAPATQEDWSCPRLFGRGGHFFARMGVSVDARLRPVDREGGVLLSNVFFAGRTLGGYDFAAEKSGGGVALATGYAAGGEA